MIYGRRIDWRSRKVHLNKRLHTLLSLSLLPVCCWFSVNRYQRIMTTVDEPKTPYERRHPWDKLPEWLKKFDLSPSTSDRLVLQNMPELCFMHIGKTGGTSLACSLGFQYEGCGNSTTLEGYLPQVTTHATHNIFNDCHDENDRTKRPYYFLFATRNPLERIISWFAYEYPEERYYDKKAPLFRECPFTTLTQLAERGLAPTPILHAGEEHVVVTPVCQQRAWDAIRGKVPYARHNAYNYRYYWQQVTPPEAPVYVMRTEHLTDDWNSVEAHLHAKFAPPNSPKYQIKGFPKQNKSFYKAAKQDRTVSSRAQELLCEGLCEDIQVYKEILRRAINLKPAQVQESIEELAQSCPEQARMEKCPTLDSSIDDSSDDSSVLAIGCILLGAAGLWNRRRVWLFGDGVRRWLLALVDAR